MMRHGSLRRPVVNGEPAWAGAVLKVPRRCMGRLRGFGFNRSRAFFMASSQLEERIHEP